MATRRRHPKRRVMRRKTAKRTSRMVKRGGEYKIGDKVPKWCSQCRDQLVYAGSTQIHDREKIYECMCTNRGCPTYNQKKTCT